MPRMDHWQGSFAAGELSPLLAGRPDTRAYAEGVAQSINGVIGPQGQWQRRPGTLFRHRLESDQAQVRLISFAPSSDRAFVLLFSHQRCEVFVVNRSTDASPPSFEFTTPWSGLEVEALDFAQSANTLFITHPGHPPHQLGYDGAGFDLSEMSFTDGPYLSLNLNDRQLFSVAGNFVQATGFAPFVLSDIGRAVRVFDESSGSWFNGIISGLASASSAVVAWDPLIAGSSTLSLAPTGQWYLGAFWSDNYPAHVALHDDRLVFANTNSNPQSFWMSVAADYLNFAPSLRQGEAVSAASAIFGTLNDASLNAIHWLAAADYSLLAATISGVWRLYSADGALSAASIQARKLDAAGAAPIAPVVVGASVLYVGRSGNQVMGLSRDGLSADLASSDLSGQAEHLSEEGIVGLCVTQNAGLRLWCRLQEGGLICLDHRAQDQQLGWTQQALAVGDSPIPVEVGALCTAARTARSGTGVDDQLWLVQQRYASGSWTRTLEVLSDPLSFEDSHWPGHFLDSGMISRLPVPTSTLGCLEHLAGQEVLERSDQGDLGAFIVAHDGTVSLPSAQTLVSVGLAYVSAVQLNDPDLGSSGRFSLTKARHVFDVRLRVWRSGPFEVGTGEPEFGSAVIPAPDLVSASALGGGGDTARFWFVPTPEPHETQAFPDVYTGDLRVRRDEGGWSRRAALCWRSAGVHALTILGVGVRLAGGD